MGLGVIGVDPERLAVGGDGLVVLAQFVMGEGEVEVRLEEPGVEL